MELHPLQVILGEVTIDGTLENDQTEELKQKLQVLGFELLDDAYKQQIEKIKLIMDKNKSLYSDLYTVLER